MALMLNRFRPSLFLVAILILSSNASGNYIDRVKLVLKEYGDQLFVELSGLAEDCANDSKEWTKENWEEIEITEVQWFLTALGLFEGQIDGLLGPQTKRAICLFYHLDKPLSGELTGSEYGSRDRREIVPKIRRASFAESERVLHPCSKGQYHFDSLRGKVDRWERRERIAAYMDFGWVFSHDDARFAQGRESKPYSGFPLLVFMDQPDRDGLHPDWEYVHPATPDLCHAENTYGPSNADLGHASSTTGILRSRLNGDGIVGLLPFLQMDRLKHIPITLNEEERFIDLLRGETVGLDKKNKLQRIFNISLHFEFQESCEDILSHRDEYPNLACDMKNVIAGSVDTALFVVSASDSKDSTRTARRPEITSGRDCKIYPACFGDLPNVLTVGASEIDGSSLTLESRRGKAMALAAPGAEILTNYDGE
ncbi:MAG: hypothetical protein AAF384_09945, partial [Pseudomonadota bacterium]